MELKNLYAEFESEDLAELAAGRLRRTVKGIRQASVHRVGMALDSHTDRQQYTILPANMRMMNYATAVMVSEISDNIHPEPYYRRTAQLLAICDADAADHAAAVLHAAGAFHVRRS
ncbi:MAG: hypothetical protein IJN57_02540 [Oscillospiraceae bacterium]|nr:hypothetical protein [Oscillospiraceae bacterium]